jgi:hypothetical protein
MLRFLNNLGVFIVFSFFIGVNYILKTSSFQWEKSSQAVGSYVLHCNSIKWSRALCFMQREREKKDNNWLCRLWKMILRKHNRVKTQKRSQSSKGCFIGLDWRGKGLGERWWVCVHVIIALHSIQDKSVRRGRSVLNAS